MSRDCRVREENDKTMIDVVGENLEYFSIKVENLALGKNVSVSTIYPYPPYSDPSNAVDGRTGFADSGLLFHTDFELYPWLTIALGTLSIVKNVILHNRSDGHGRWLHNVEIRGGISSVWSEMNTCGTFVGPSQTGKIHTIECGARPLLNVLYVTVKIVRPNYITDDWNARDGKNALGLEEVVVNGLNV
ncbi:uncharacterized protein LOC133187624 [Saccostrea echinata]|uniref:uncharacterized protein LOC133187624 n=1 Tax=Saccostrea echinata TaxID=191078 RepID=UPI002A820C76|nr:uncharacterized protein LOC133187624 [Saccostrea echinata]